MTDDRWTNERWTDVGTIAYLALKAGQLKYRNTEPNITIFWHTDTEYRTDLKKIPTKTPNTDTDVKYRHRPMTIVQMSAHDGSWIPVYLLPTRLRHLWPSPPAIGWPWSSRLFTCELAAYGGRSFAYAVPSNWNSLPAYLRDSSLSLSSFKRHLKTFLFSFY